MQGMGSHRQKAHGIKGKAGTKEYAADWYRQNKARARAASVRWEEKNRTGRNSYRVKLRKKNGEATRQREARWRENNPDKVRAGYTKHRLKKKFNLTPEEYQEMFDLQGQRCLICKCSEGMFCIDHCHATKVIRGILCRDCNLLLGMAKDNPNTLRAAIIYLKKYGETDGERARKAA